MGTAVAEPRLCFALDVPTAGDAIAWVDLLADDVGVFKIGLELFVAEGPSIVRRIRARGVDVFLDLKLHDIPNTVASAVRRAVDLDVRYLTLHASGGPAMMRQAAQAAQSTSTVLLAVTILTSLGDDELLRAGHVGGAVMIRRAPDRQRRPSRPAPTSSSSAGRSKMRVIPSARRGSWPKRSLRRRRERGLRVYLQGFPHADSVHTTRGIRCRRRSWPRAGSSRRCQHAVVRDRT